MCELFLQARATAFMHGAFPELVHTPHAVTFLWGKLSDLLLFVVDLSACYISSRNMSPVYCLSVSLSLAY